MEKEVFKIGQIVRIDLKKLRNDQMFLDCSNEDADKEIIWGEIQSIFPGGQETFKHHYYTIKEIKEFDSYNQPVYGRIFVCLSDTYIMVESKTKMKAWFKDMKYELLKNCMAKKTSTKMEPRIWVTDMKHEQMFGPFGFDSTLNLECSVNDEFMKLILNDRNILNKAVKQYCEREEPSCMCASGDGNENGDTDGDVEICLDIDRVIFNDPATIIFWKSWHWERKEYEEDGIKKYEQFKVQDKTIVKCSPEEKFNKYNGFCAAVAKRVFETNSAIHRIIENATDDSSPKKLLKEIEKAGKKVKAQKENIKRSTKKNG